MSKQLGKINSYVGESFTNEWSVTLMDEVDGELVEGQTKRINLENKISSYDFNEGDIVTLNNLKSWGWAVGMYKAKASKNRKWN